MVLKNCSTLNQLHGYGFRNENHSLNDVNWMRQLCGTNLQVPSIVCGHYSNDAYQEPSLHLPRFWRAVSWTKDFTLFFCYMDICLVKIMSFTLSFGCYLCQGASALPTSPHSLPFSILCFNLLVFSSSFVDFRKRSRKSWDSLQQIPSILILAIAHTLYMHAFW